MEQKCGSALQQAIARMDAKDVLDLVATRGEEGALEALHAIWESDALFEKRPSKKAAQRVPFLEAVAGGLAPKYPEVAEKVLELPAVLTLVEEGFVQILSRSKSFPGSKLPPMGQVSAALSFASSAQAELEALGREQLPTGPIFEMKATFSVDGRVVDPDTEMFGVLKAATATIMMMAYENRWFTESDQVELPQLLSRPSPSESTAIYPVLEGASRWHAWDRAQLRLRFGLRSVEYLEKPFPHGFPESIDTAVRILPRDEIELVDFVANDRLVARTRQHLIQLLQDEPRSNSYADLTASVALPPSGFLSFDEKHGIITLSECTSFDVTKDQNSYSGLRIIEWLRGYAVLKRIAEQANPVATELHECPQFTEAELLGFLTRAGLSTEKSQLFLQQVCLTKSRNDAYDRPLIRVSGERYVMVAPALKSALLGPIVLSAICDAGAQIEIKGKAFEETIRRKIAGPGRKVGFFKAKRDGEEYDYDALLVWGEFCFLFECKNRSLSGGILQHVYRSDVESRSRAHQVHRLVHGVMTHPDMLEAHFPAARGKLLVPCVISALPYSVPGGVEGVLFSDYSMLTRFFASPVIGQLSISLGKPPQRLPEREIFRQWSGDEPTPFDLLRHLTCSFQFVLTTRHTFIRPFVTDVFSEQDALFHGEYGSIDPTLESSRAAAAHYASSVPIPTLQDCENQFKRLP